MADDCDSDGEHGENFMAKVRDMEARGFVRKGSSSKQDGGQNDVTQSRESEENGTQESASVQKDCASTESNKHSKRRARAKNFKVAKLKRIQKVKRKFGIK